MAQDLGRATRLMAATAIAWGLTLAVCPAPARADAVGDFYKGKQISLVIGFAPGAGYDTYGRLFARHYPAQMPGNPAVVVQNMPGAGSLKAANHLYNLAAKDGSVLGSFASSTAFEPLFGGEGAQFDTAKFTWIGNMDESIGTCVAWHSSGIDKFDDLMVKDSIFGGSGPAAVTSQHAVALKNLMGAKIKLVQGYNGAGDVKLAMARGEVQASCGFALSSIKSQHTSEWKSGQIKILVQLAIDKTPELAGVPHLYDYAKTDEMRQVFDLVFGRHVIGRPIAAPPTIPEDRKQALRAAFMATMKDAAFLADADKLKLDVSASDGEGVEKLFARFFGYPQAAVDKAIAAMKE